MAVNYWCPIPAFGEPGEIEGRLRGIRRVGKSALRRLKRQIREGNPAGCTPGCTPSRAGSDSSH